MMPITSIARESRGVETKHRANLSGAQGGNQTIKAGSLDGATCGATEIIVDHFDIGEAASTCDFNQLVLAPLALQVQLNLQWRRQAGHRRPPCAGEQLPEGERHALSSLASRLATPPASSRSRAIALSTARRSAGVMARNRTSSRTSSSWRGAVRLVCLQASSVLRASANRASILRLLRDDVAVRGDEA